MRQIWDDPNLTLTIIIATITVALVSIGYTFKLTEYFFIRIGQCIMGVTSLQHHKRSSQPASNFRIHFQRIVINPYEFLAIN